jgi:transposase-like protein
MKWKAERTRATGRKWPSPTLARTYFGGWNAALDAAGFETYESGHYGRPGDDPATLTDAAARYRDGQTIEGIAAHYGVKPATARDWLRTEGVQFPLAGRGWASNRPLAAEIWDERRATLVELIREGLTEDQIAERLNMPAGTVSTWIRRTGARKIAKGGNDA